jgi:hypothetical protein
MDRANPSEEVLAEMRTADLPVCVGTPKGRLSKPGRCCAPCPGERFARGSMSGFSPGMQEMYVLAQSHAPTNAPCGDASSNGYGRFSSSAATENLSREERLMKLGAARFKVRAAWRLIDVEVAEKDATSPSRSTATSYDR